MGFIDLSRLCGGLLLTLTVLLMSVSSVQGQNAQPDGLKATVVTADGDSLNGQIEQWRPKPHTPTKIRFHHTSTQSATTYRPQELQAFKLDAPSRQFVSRTVQVDQVPTNPKDATDFLRKNRQIKKTDTLFLEVVVKGPLTLYTRQGERDRYYAEKEHEITELIKRRRFVESKRAIATDDRYRQQLANLMRDCPEVQRDAQDVRLDFHPLRSLAARYNRCITGSSPSFLAEKQRSTWHTALGIAGGAVFSLPLTDGSDAIGTATYDPTLGYRAEGWVHFRSGSGAGNLAIQLELAYADERINGGSTLNSTLSGTDRAATRTSRVEITQKTIRLTSLIRFYYGSGTWEPYIEIGPAASYGLSFDEYVSLRTVTDDGTVIRDTEGKYLPDDFQRNAIGAEVGIGIKWNSFRVGLRHGEYRGFSNAGDSFFSMLNTNTSIRISYQIW